MSVLFLGIDFHIGLSPSEEYRVARVSLPQLSGLLGEIWHDKRIAQQVYNFWTSDKNSPMARAISNPSWLNVVTQCTVNNPDQHFMEQAGIDFHIGLSSSEEYRVARVSLPQLSGLLGEIWHDKRIAQQVYNFWTSDKNSPMARAISNPSWLNVVTQCTVNNPDQHFMEQAGALGIGNARSLAAIFNLFVNGRIVSEKTLSLLKKPVNNETDFVLQMHAVKGHGFFYAPLLGDETELMIGHTGHGCQQVVFDLKNKVVIAYVTNGLKAGLFDRCRTYARIQKAVYDVLQKQ
ncbi:hypothetical protein ANCCAN_00558 [Ancylostoma caninum]|uniref:Beta-lactamase-related domain-containing protein n=1 Tax=Ancylostoma caninum TaxID=29170 RepID=A0A368HA61_ANCCA|nr:hypothetical protein ANCCAN_00558 [Ancylostoma caninum]